MAGLLCCLLLPNSAWAADLSVRVGQLDTALIPIQKALVKLNYKLDRTDGFYSMATVRALQNFQKAKGLKVTGRPDSKTCRLLLGENIPSIPAQASVAAAVSKPVPAGTTVSRPSPAKISATGRSVSVVKPTKTSSAAVAAAGSGFSTKGAQYNGNPDVVVNAAQKYKGAPYRFGGTTTKGFDCSGYTMKVFKDVGISLPRSADEQYKLGTYIPKSKLKKGDLVFFSTYEPGPSHVGIYDGKGYFWNATTSRGVMASPINDPHYWGPKYIGARRILK